MYKHFIITVLLGSSIACTANTKKTETKEVESTHIGVVEGIETSESEVKEIDSIVFEEETIEESTPEIVEKQVTVSEVKTETTPKEEEVVVKETEPKEVVAYSPSHSAFDALLKKYVTSTGKVNYAGIKTERAKLDAYLGVLAKNEPSSSWKREEKLAYWINLYNAGTIQLILNNYPTKSIMDINGGKAWDVKFIKSGTKTLSLNQIENEIIRPTFKEPRIHFAVNCAAVSCPKLLNRAFQPHILEKQLETATRKFINNKAKNTISASSIKISQIFDWYAVDFGGKANLVKYFNKYSTIKINSSASVSFQEYNWDLNK